MDHTSRIRERLARAVAAAGLNPDDLADHLDREAAARAAAADPARQHSAILKRVAEAACAREAAYRAWQDAIAAATAQGAPLRLVAQHAGVSRSRVSQIAASRTAA